MSRSALMDDSPANPVFIVVEGGHEDGAGYGDPAVEGGAMVKY